MSKFRFNSLRSRRQYRETVTNAQQVWDEAAKREQPDIILPKTHKCAAVAVTRAMGEHPSLAQQVVDSLRSDEDATLRCERSAECVLRIVSGNFNASPCVDQGHEVTVMTNLSFTKPLE